jgi:glycosyltransferase involved in cell wall biosynthesis
MTIRFLLLRQLLHLKAMGYSVSVACALGPWTAEIEQAGIPVKPIGLTRKINPMRDLLALIELYFHFRKERPTIVHTHTPKANLLGRFAARLASVPIVLGTEHGFYFYGKPAWSYRFHLAIARLGAFLSDVTLVINCDDFELAQREKIADHAKLVYLRGGVGINLDRFNPQLVDRLTVRNQLGISSTTRVVGIVARLTYEKGLKEFLQAASYITSTIPETCFLIVGPEDQLTRQQLEAMVEQLALSNRVLYLGTRTDMPEVYAAMDVIVVPSYREGLGVVLIEAGAMGKPVVASNIRGCREVVRDGQNGLLVPLGDVQALADATIELLTDQEKARRMGEEGRRMALERFDERLVFEQVEAEYARLLRERGLPVPQPLSLAKNPL